MDKCSFSGERVDLPHNPENLPVECPQCWYIRKLRKDGIYPLHEDTGPAKLRRRWKLSASKGWQVVNHIAIGGM